MYVDPFVAGVLTTLFAELVALVITAIIRGGGRRK